MEKVMAYIVLAYIGIADIAMAYVAMIDIVVAYIVILSYLWMEIGVAYI